MPWKTGDLLDWAENRARSSDPETSKQAAADIAVVLNKLEKDFLEALKELTEATSNEVAAKVSGDNFARRNSIRRRASDLMAKRLIEAVGNRVCKVSGKKATVYRKCYESAK
jgi:CO dehydrogenase nickel-insertion accessory protein CooC1